MQQSHDVIVIGAGAMGAATAWALSRQGKRVLLLEQFQVGHTRGASHGGSRIVRYAHPEVEYAALMPHIFSLWRDLEMESGESLMEVGGGLYIGAVDDPWLAGTEAAMAKLGMECERLSATDLHARYPQFRLDEKHVALFQPQSGMLAASKCVATMVRMAQSRGVSLKGDAVVQEIAPGGGGYRVHYLHEGHRRHATATRVVVTAGPWAAHMLPSLLNRTLPLVVTQQQVAYFRVEDPALWSLQRCPIYIFTADPHVYGFPIYERPGLIKVAQELFDTYTDPDEPRRVLPESVDTLSSVIARRFNGVDPEPVEVVPCLYTETPNRDFIIDRHPEMPGVIFAAGFSGRGFKFSIGIGELLADLATSDRSPADHPGWLPWWALNRFADADDRARSAVEIFGR